MRGHTRTCEPTQRPPTPQVAFQQADYVAWNVWAGINRRPLLPFKYQHLGDMMSLGAHFYSFRSRGSHGRLRHGWSVLAGHRVRSQGARMSACAA